VARSGEDFPSSGRVPALRAGASALLGRGLCARRWRAVLGPRPRGGRRSRRAGLTEEEIASHSRVRPADVVPGVLLAARRFQSADGPVKAKRLRRRFASLDSPAVRPERAAAARRTGKNDHEPGGTAAMSSIGTRRNGRRECEGQLWLQLEWSAPTGRVAVSCRDCGWRGRRPRRGCTSRPCPRCGARVERGRWPVSSPAPRPAARRKGRTRQDGGGAAVARPTRAREPGAAGWARTAPIS